MSRHRSTIYREIQRNRFEDSELPQLSGYCGMLAQKRAAERRHGRRKLIRMTALREAVIDRLKAGWSPGQIAGRLRVEGHSSTICHETIYAFVYSQDGQSQDLARHLPERRRQRKARYARRPRSLVFPLERVIQNRPDHVNDRSSKHQMNRLIALLSSLPQSARRSITFDRGFELNRWRYLPRDMAIATLSDQAMV